jgi:hypothetical protein
MMARGLAVLTAASLLVALHPAAAADESPFLIDKKIFKRQVKSVALAPIDAPEAVRMPDSAEAIILEEIVKHLRKRGYEVIPASVLGDIRDTMKRQVGGYQDAKTGRVDMARMQAVREHGHRELLFRHQVDGIASIRIRVVKADYENDNAKWDGTRQRVKHKGGGKFKGTISASSVSVSIFDRKDKLLFTHRGGLEVLLERDRGQLKPLPPEAYFQDEKRIRKAAKEAVSPL